MRPALCALCFFLAAVTPRADTTAPAPTVSALRAAFPGYALRQVGAYEFQHIVEEQAGRGKLLTGDELAAAVSASAADSQARKNTATPVSTRDSAALRCRGLDSLRAKACRDSLAAGRAMARDSLQQADDDDGVQSPQAVDEEENRTQYPRARRVDSDETRVEEERAKGYFAQFFLDLQNGDWDMGSKDWAAVIYVVVGLVVVGVFVIYGIDALVGVAMNRDHDPVFKEVGLRYSYSGSTWNGGGPPLYRNANLLGGRFSFGVERKGVDVGVTLEGGYIDLSLRGVQDPARVFDFRGGYLVAGPLLRMGSGDPVSFDLEFLNGTSNHSSIGWISKSRMILNWHFPAGAVAGINLGAVFYDLAFLDGLAWRSGNFNRDLSLVMGFEAGWEF